jgi:hypothetical protein
MHNIMRKRASYLREEEKAPKMPPLAGKDSPAKKSALPRPGTKSMGHAEMADHHQKLADHFRKIAEPDEAPPADGVGDEY